MTSVEGASTNNSSLGFSSPRLMENLLPQCHSTLKCQTGPDKKSKLPTVN